MTRIRMVKDRVFQDAGRERLLQQGVEYDLPEGIAERLLAAGVAIATSTETGAAPRRAPETKPEPPFETKRRCR